MKTRCTKAMRDALATHELLVLAEGPEVSLYEMRAPGGSWVYGVRLVFVHAAARERTRVPQIILSGDVILTDQRVVTALGYDLDWYLSRLSEDYMAEKFLRKEWQQEIAIEEIGSHVLDEEYFDAKTREGLKEMLGDLERDWGGDWSADRLFDRWYPLMNGRDMGLPGYGYPMSEQGWLVAIHERFRDLYRAREEAAKMAG